MHHLIKFDLDRIHISSKTFHQLYQIDLERRHKYLTFSPIDQAVKILNLYQY